MTDLETAHKRFTKHLDELGRSPSTLIAYGKDIEQLIEYLSKKGVNAVEEVELTHLEDFMQKLANEGYTAKSISRKTNSTKTFFRFLIEEGMVEKNVADLLKHPKVDVKAPRILSKLEYRALRDAARDDVRSYALIEVLLQTGITISELAGMKIEHLNLDGPNSSLLIPGRHAKERREVPLNEVAVSAIRQYIAEARPDGKDSEYLFITKTGNPLLVRNIRSTIDRYFKLAGVEDAKVNDLRHTFIANQLAQGTSLTYISKIVGHKRASTTERYLEYVDRKVEEENTEITPL